MRRLLRTTFGIALACSLAGAAHATDVDGPNDCARSNRDFGDAPEGTAVLAYPGVPGRFPTCITPGPVGTQNVACVPISTAPGPTGYVQHNSAVGQPLYWLGCPPGAAPFGIDSEGDGKVNNSAVVGAASACSGIATDCVETAFGLSFGQDECYGSTDAGVLKPAFKVCSMGTVTFTVTNCTGTPTVFLNILVDMNHDGDWNDNFQCPGACAYEWAVKNAPLTLPPGCTTFTSPSFLVGPNPGPGWMRVTISTTAVNNDFPWAGSATMAGASLTGGETEDYPVNIRKPVAVTLSPTDIDWVTTAAGTVRFHLVFRNNDPEDPSDPATGQIMSQRFGVFQDDVGTIGQFSVPELAANSFFDVFTEISLDQLPPSAQKILPWVGMMADAATGTAGCPPDDHWDGNVDINWSSPAGGGQVNKHIGTIEVCPSHGNSYIHTLVFCTAAAGASWTITGVCPGWSATLVNEGPPGVPDGPAPNPVPPGWTGYICISANATVSPGATCPIQVTFTCAGVPGTIDLRPVACDCTQNACQIDYKDFGDAPEELRAYATGVSGRFPTCVFPTPPGTQTIGCGAPQSTPPGPTGYVLHLATATDPVHFWLGCGIPPGFGGVDAEANGKVDIAAAAGMPSICDPNVLTDCVEISSDGLSFGQDECTGDGVDAAIASPVVVRFCSPSTLTFNAFNCSATSIDVFVNVLFDWNQDGDWNDNVACATACAYEWTFKNYVVVLAPGCNAITLPGFQGGPMPGASWMRLTLTHVPVKDDFPWNGSLSEPNGYYNGGETEDYPVDIESGSTGVDDRLPGDIKLGVLPNPSNTAVNVSLALPRESHVALAVYDVTGRKLATLAGGVLPAGEKTIRWNLRADDGRDVPVGLYLVRADIGGRVYTRTFVRVR